MIFTKTTIEGVLIIDRNKFEDDRGWFTRVYCKNEFLNAGVELEFVQLNHSFTKYKGTLRGMHFQRPPFGEDKLIKCASGAVYDVVVDLRKNSPTFLEWTAIELSQEQNNMILIPKGCAHGFQTLTDNTLLTYHHTQYYNPNYDSGVRYDDPLLDINWPLKITEISNKDQSYPLLDRNFKGLENNI